MISKTKKKKLSFTLNNFFFTGLIQGIFETLYDSNVVSEEGFESWVSVDDPLEREGKAVALKMITSFLTWLKEADPESDQEADA